jgi:hypothetical protein
MVHRVEKNVEATERNGCLKCRDPMKMYDVADFPFFELCIVMNLSNKNQQNACFSH